MASTAERSETPDDGLSATPAWFEDLYKRNNDVLYQVILRIGSPAIAEEVRQETLLRAWQHRSVVVSLHENQQRVWLLTTARRLVIDSSRRTKPMSSMPTEEMVDPAGRLDRIDEVLDVRRALARLSGEQREVLALRYRADLQIAEIARVLDISETAVSTRLDRARRAFEEAYRQGGTR
jgi:RNA polymerase sigma-70 factor (ECF subfamily)